MTNPAPTLIGSAPSQPFRVLICDEMNPGNLEHAGFDIEYVANMPRADILKRLPDFDALITRSRTKVDR